MRDVLLRLCYVHNGPETQAVFRLMTGQKVNTLVMNRYKIEKGIRQGVNSLRAAHVRLTILHNYLVNQQGVLTEDELDKDRQGIAKARSSVSSIHTLIEKTLNQAKASKDVHYQQHIKVRQLPAEMLWSGVFDSSLSRCPCVKIRTIG